MIKTKSRQIIKTAASGSSPCLSPHRPLEYNAGMASRDFWARSLSDSWRRWAIPGALLVLCVILAYLPVSRAGFIWDDDVYITKNPLLTAPDGLWQIWFTLDAPSQYFPLAITGSICCCTPRTHCWCGTS